MIKSKFINFILFTCIQISLCELYVITKADNCGTNVKFLENTEKLLSKVKSKRDIWNITVVNLTLFTNNSIQIKNDQLESINNSKSGKQMKHVMKPSEKQPSKTAAKEYLKLIEATSGNTEYPTEVSVYSKSVQNVCSSANNSQILYDIQPVQNSLNFSKKNLLDKLYNIQKIKKQMQDSHDNNKTFNNDDPKIFDVHDHKLHNKEMLSKFNSITERLLKIPLCFTCNDNVSSAEELETEEFSAYATKSLKKNDGLKKTQKENLDLDFTRPICSTCGGANKTSTSSTELNPPESSNSLDINDNTIMNDKDIDDKSDFKLTSVTICLTCCGANKTCSTESTFDVISPYFRDKYGYRNVKFSNVLQPKKACKLIKTIKHKTTSEKQHNLDDFLFLNRKRDENYRNKTALWQRIKSKYLNTKLNRKYNDQNDDNGIEPDFPKHSFHNRIKYNKYFSNNVMKKHLIDK
ncbi:uncharacterized protein LOC142327035 [Lycorma delicatula]|uniref:uncharacterized protein LOC142327035 n=1 Tax=Lycorma delicatula TaxID=130591 RepID=UPI003F51A8B1